MKLIHLIFLLTVFCFSCSVVPEDEVEPEKDPTKKYLHGRAITGTITANLVLEQDDSIRTLGVFYPIGDNPTGVKSIAGGGKHILVLKNDGTVWAWGMNDHSQLGDNSEESNVQKSLVQVSNLDNIIAISASIAHSLALKSDGTVWAWGNNSKGQLGDNTLENKNYPVQVAGVSGAVAIAAGGIHSVIVKNDGTVWGWGSGIPLGTDEAVKQPGQIAGLSNIVSVAAGTDFTLALKSDGTVWAVGYNAIGQLGIGNYTDQQVPVQVPGISDVAVIAAGNSSSMVIKNDSTVWGWGDNYFGNLGDGSNATRPSPVQAKYLKGIIAISCGWYSNSLAIDKDSTVWNWGRLAQDDPLGVKTQMSPSLVELN